MPASPTPDAAPAPRPLRRRWLALVFLLSLIRHAPFADDPFDRGFEAMMGARYQGVVQAVWAERGFLATGGRPIMRPEPTIPVSGPVYANHPPTWAWIVHPVVRLRGPGPLSFRLPAMIFTALATVLMVVLAARRFAVGGALAATALCLTSPALFFYGRQSGYTAPLLAIYLALFLVALDDARRPPRRAALFALSFAAGLFDWTAVFMLPGLWLLDSIRRRGWPRRALVIASVAGVGLALASYCVLLVVWTGGITEALESLRTARATVLRRADIALLAFLGNQVDHLRALFGAIPSGLLVLGLGPALFRVLRGRGRELDALLLAWTLIPLLQVIAFPYHAMNHDFWWYHLLPAVLLSSLGALDALRRLHPALAGLLLLLICGLALRQIEARYRDENRGEAQAIAANHNLVFTERDVLVDLHGASPATYYTRARVMDLVQTVAELERVLDRHRDGDYGPGDLVVFFPAVLGEYLPGFEELLASREGTRLVTGSVAYWKAPPPRPPARPR